MTRVLLIFEILGPEIFQKIEILNFEVCENFTLDAVLDAVLKNQIYLRENRSLVFFINDTYHQFSAFFSKYFLSF